MDRPLIEPSAQQRFIRMLIQTTNDQQKNINTNEMLSKKNESFPYTMLITLISSVIIVGIILGLAINRYYTYYHRRQNTSKDLSYSVSRYWRKQFVSTSFDSVVASPSIKNLYQSNDEINETSRIIKNSFSWPEATLLRQQQQQEYEQEKGEYTSTSLSNSSTMESLFQPSTLTFGIRWDEPTDSLFVRVINAQNLLNYRHHHRPSTLIDSYVRIELLSEDNNTTQASIQSMRTHIIKKNLHPIYDELFEFSNINQIYKNNNNNKLSLLFTVLTYDTFTRDEILGQVEFSIISSDVNTSNNLQSTETIFTRDIIPRHKQLCTQELGQMLVSLCYQPTDSTITIIVLKASNLPRLSTTRLINPYFKIYMFYKGQRIVKKRSTIKRTTQSPVYNECFTFHIPDNDLENIRFSIILFDYDRHMKHEPIGTFSIGNTSNEINNHWNDVCHRQIAKQIAQWYQLKPFNILNY